MEIEYQPVESGKYRHQATVTEYPGRLARWLGAPPEVRVFVSDHLTDGYEHVGWYEVPTFDELRCTSPIAKAIGRTIRQQLFAEASA